MEKENLEIRENYSGYVVTKIICDYFSIPIQELKERKRTRNLVFTRQIIFYFLKKKTRMTTVAIGDRFNLSHSAVLHGVTSLNKLLDYDVEVKAYVNELNAIIDEKIGGKIRKKAAEHMTYVDLNNATSFIFSETKSITISGFTKEEIETISQKLKINTKLFPPVEFKKTNVKLSKINFEKDETEEKKDSSVDALNEKK